MFLGLLLIAGATGFLLGLFLLRVPIVALGSVVLVLLGAFVALLAQWGLLGSVVFIVALIGTLQGTYLIGVIVSSAWTRAKAPNAILRSSHIDQCRT
jgi:hypothetical protein